MRPIVPMSAVRRWFRSSSADWIVIEFNGFTLRGLWAGVEVQGVEVRKAIESNRGTLDASFAEVIEGLDGGDGRLPVKGILVTSQAVASVIELPTPDDRSRSPAELKEVVRWEFEPYLHEQLSTLTLEMVLVGRGLVSVDDVALAREAMASNVALSPSMGGDASRLAEQVMAMGMAGRDKVVECLALLDAHDPPEGDLAVDSSPLRDRRETAEGGVVPYLVCGVSERERRQWVTRFAGRGIRLERIYPWGIAVSGTVEAGGESPSQGVLEVIEGRACYSVFRGNQLESLRWGSSSVSKNPGAPWLEWARGDGVGDLWVSGKTETIGMDADLPGDGGGFRIRRMTSDSRWFSSLDCEPPFGVEGMLGALRHWTGQTQRMIPWTGGAGPGPPWWKRVGYWWGIGGLGLGCLVGSAEFHLWLRRQSIERKLTETEAQLVVAQNAIRERERDSAAAARLEERIMENRIRLTNADVSLGLLERGLKQRREYVVNVLLALAKAVPPEVAVNEVRELKGHVFEIKAFALTERSSQEFVKSLADRLERWGLSVEHQRVSASRGRLGIDGYAIELRLMPNPGMGEKT